ncbi:MAG: ribosome biogenesis GTP-binding protein YihA/YsxC [Thermodesulfobacteriota bacterium]|nr:ribosome biogenesis GTP-binding protein YihA/YsxC [Thermodesulfobacteriota bacterium]
MHVHSVDFLKSVYKLPQLPDADRPEVAFVGRSNVGKSSFINTLVGRKKLAQVSKDPGRTQSLNFYQVNDVIYFVDLPGYGYARVPVSVRKDWKGLIEGYLTKRSTLKAVVVIFDIRRLPNEEDLSLLSWFESHHIPYIIVLSKADKLSSNKKREQISRIGQLLSVKAEDMIPFSSLTGAGKEATWERLEKLLYPASLSA